LGNANVTQANDDVCPSSCNPIHHSTRLQSVVEEKVIVWSVTLRNSFDYFLGKDSTGDSTDRAQCWYTMSTQTQAHRHSLIPAVGHLDHTKRLISSGSYLEMHSVLNYW